MVKIYTRKGDDGTTGLWYGGRGPKASGRTAPEAEDRLEAGVSRVTGEMVDRLEADIDRYMEQVDLPPKFVIPGGTELSARLDIARASIRRAERRVSELSESGELADDTVLRYLNRASDAVYAMARVADESEPELFGGRG